MNLPQRKNHRLKNYDYGSAGYYYVTICTMNREPLLSRIDTVGSHALVAPLTSTIAIPTIIGNAISECFYNIERLNPYVTIDKFVLMPNHIHAIIIIDNQESLPSTENRYAFEISERRGRRSLQGLVKDFKSVSTRIYKKYTGATTSLWQDSFYDEIIRDELHYRHVWEYIENNPIQWVDDELYTM